MTPLFSSKERNNIFLRMSQSVYDVLVIGGGITGAGIALDAASRGLKVLLVDKQDFAAGTSSRSTKLVHGGLRYLKNLEFGVVAEVGKERAVVYENAPHVTTPERMLLPIYRGGTFGKLSTSLGLRVYDWLAGVKRSERRTMLNAKQALGREPLLMQDGLLGGGMYVEYRTDDARLTLETVKKAVQLGAVAINYADVETLLVNENGKVRGARITDRTATGDEQRCEVTARYVVNAAGPWVDELRVLDRSRTGKTLLLTKGVHLVFDGARFSLGQAVYFDTPDGRMVFAIPRDGKTYVGTTDTRYEGDLHHPRIEREDREYLLKAINSMFPNVRLTAADVESGWCGLRPLIRQEGKSPSEISRRDEIFESPSGLLSIAGGKLTGYRKMAESVVDRIADRMRSSGQPNVPPCQTRNMRLSGGDTGGGEGFADYVAAWTAEGERLGLSRTEAEWLVRRYGSNVPTVLAYYAPKVDSRTTMPAVLRIALDYAIEHEMAVSPLDFFMRRTGMLLFDIDSVRNWHTQVTERMAAQLGYTSEERRIYEQELARELAYCEGIGSL